MTVAGGGGGAQPISISSTTTGPGTGPSETTTQPDTRITTIRHVLLKRNFIPFIT
jgi:hypothetical protein